MEEKFKVNDIVNWNLGDGGNYKIVGTKKHPIIFENGLPTVYPKPNTDYILQSLIQTVEFKPFDYANESHLRLVDNTAS